jgi:PAS domain S-box-containing protein
METPNLGRVLVVDDEIELLTALCEVLTEQGYEVVGMASASAALACLQTQDIDLLVSDLMMPDMDGIALLQAALDIDPHLVGMIMTGQGTIQTAVDAMKVGAFDYILKPFKLQTLLPVLQRALQVRRLRKENLQLRETMAIYELGQALAYTLDFNTILHKIADGAWQQVGGEEACILLPTPEGDELYVAAVSGQAADGRLGRRIPMTQSVMGTVVANREPLTVAGTLGDISSMPPPGQAEFTTMALPMLAGGQLVGVLSVKVRRRHRPFTLGQVKALSILANLAATALENASLYAQVRQSEARYRALVEGSLQGIALVKTDGTYLFTNTALARMLGYEQPADLVGRRLWEQVVPQEVSRLQATFAVRPEGASVSVRCEYQAVKKDHTRIWVECLTSPLTWDGEPVILGTYIDLSERKHLEAQLRQAQKMQAIGTLAGGIAHDFNNILAAILGYTELTMQDVGADSAAWSNLQMVYTAGQRAKSLVQQILAFSRRTEGERHPLQLQLLVKETLALLRATLPASIVLQQTLDPEAGWVLADPTQMRQVVLNLCTNAAHAMLAHGGEIAVRLQPRDVTTDCTPSVDLKAGSYVCLSVRDNGHGIPPEILERIFEPFFTTKKVGEGTGLGLAVVHGIVTGHGGAITVESTPGRGTTFAVYLPRSATAAASTTAGA